MNNVLLKHEAGLTAVLVAAVVVEIEQRSFSPVSYFQKLVVLNRLIEGKEGGYYFEYSASAHKNKYGIQFYEVFLYISTNNKNQIFGGRETENISRVVPQNIFSRVHKLFLLATLERGRNRLERGRGLFKIDDKIESSR